MNEIVTENGIHYIRLSDLSRRIEQVVSESFGASMYWVIAEVSSHKYYPNQARHYFDFIEKQENGNEPIAKMRGVSWFAGSQCISVFEKNTGQTFTNGLQVLVKVKVEYHIAFGLSLVLQDIDQSFTLGNIEKQRRATLQRLVTENPDSIKQIGDEYWTKNKGIKLNAIIQNIALIGSSNSEGYNDFKHTLQNNQYNYKFNIDIYYSSVQGADAEKELVNSLVSIYETFKQYDCIVIIRGGGAKSDFIVFDTYNVSRAVARFPIPIITGIGHHKDVSIVDMMSNTSVKTPTKAAEFIIAHNRNFEDQLLILQKEIIIKSQQLMSYLNQKINGTNITIINNSRTLINNYKDLLNNFNQTIINKSKSILFNRQTNLLGLLNQLLSKPKIITAQKSSELINLSSNIQLFAKKYIVNYRGYLGHYESVIKLMSPNSILKRGFAILTLNGRILKNASTIQPGNEIIVSMEDYEVTSKVLTKTKSDGSKSYL